MKVRIILGVILMLFVMNQAGIAEGKDNIQNYFSKTACKVKAADEPGQKREILNTSLETMSRALERVENSGLVSQDERDGIDRFKTALQEKQNELTGSNGYDRVSDTQLNAFSDYVVQDMEQAARSITISVVGALLILIVLILIL